MPLGLLNLNRSSLHQLHHPHHHHHHHHHHHLPDLTRTGKPPPSSSSSSSHRFLSICCLLQQQHTVKDPTVSSKPSATTPSRHVSEKDPIISGNPDSSRDHDPFCGRNLPDFTRIFADLGSDKRPESEAYASLLRHSADSGSLPHAHLAHFHIIQSGRHKNSFLGSLIIQTYIRCGMIVDAHAWFLRMHDRNVFSWTFMITELVQLGQGKEAFPLFDRMLHESVLPDEHIFTSIISGCGCEFDLIHGSRFHSQISGCGFDTSLVVGNALVNMYGKCGSLENAQLIFDRMSIKNVITWTAIITAHVQHGDGGIGFDMFEKMYSHGVFPNKVTVLSIVDACTASMEKAKHIHTYVILGGFDADVFVSTALISMYGKLSNPECALCLFTKMPERTVVSWNAMITVCAEHGLIMEAFQLFLQMHEKGMVLDKVSYVNIANALANQEDPFECKQMHHLIVEEGFECVMDVATALIHMYGRCRSLDDARRIFIWMIERTSVTWNYMIRVYSCYGQDVPAKQLLEQMNQEGVFSDKFIASSMISAYATKVALREGKWIHASLTGTAFETDTVVSTALLNMYCKCGSLIHARSVFDKMTTRDAVSWNAMMDGYAQYGDVMNVQAFFNFMQKEGVAPDTATFVSSLSACARLVALTEGRQFYNGSILRGFEEETAIATAIFDMYAKCGSIQEALKMFENMPERNEVSWSAMIAAYSRHGHGKEALVLFERMLAAGCQPNEVTFVSVLYACSHAGLLEEGRKWWYAMRCDYGIAPIPDHFDCMIDLYCRMGQLEEAEDLIKDMPIDPTAVSWMTLLSACRSKTDLCRGARAAKRILDLDASDPSPHPILHNLYHIDSSREECDGTGN